MFAQCRSAINTLWVTGLASGLLVAPANATDFTWPGASPCNSTLMQCIAAATENDRVLIASNSVIDESLSITRPLSLLAAPGFRPVLNHANNHLINLNPSQGGWRLLLQGIRFDNPLQIRIAGASGTVELDALNFPRSSRYSNQSTQLNISLESTALSSFMLRRSEFTLASPNIFAMVNISGSLTQANQFLFRDNVFYASSALDEVGVPAPLVATLIGNNESTVVLARNQVLPARDGSGARLPGGFYAQSFQTQILNLLVHDNLLQLGQTPGGGTGIAGGTEQGALRARIINNTVLGAYYGHTVSGPVGNREFRLDNNIFAGGFRFSDSQLPATMARNILAFGYQLAPILPYPAGTLTAEPQLDAEGYPHGSSPAVNAGNTPARDELGPGALNSLPGIDVLGLNRVVGNTVDIGAIEAERLLRSGFE